jgi:hypothetical protein
VSVSCWKAEDKKEMHDTDTKAAGPPKNIHTKEKTKEKTKDHAAKRHTHGVGAAGTFGRIVVRCCHPFVQSMLS